MSRQGYCRALVTGCFLAVAAVPGLSAQGLPVPPYDSSLPPGEPPPVPAPEGSGLAGPEKGAVVPGPEVQGRGPVHEAFAQPSEAPRGPGPVVARQPPEPIAEQPPEVRPEGDNVAWIPGYWAWDADRGDFLWVSGFWRVVPTGRKWYPGYWARANGGWRWVSGFWAPADPAAVPYVEQPPPSIERGPSIPAPDERSFYIPGAWVWQDPTFLWRPGYWCPQRPGLVYVPPRCSWTPRGYAYVNGYWDRPLEGRGLLFAPVAFSGGVGALPGTYQPSCALSTQAVLDSLWVRPGLGQYAFGDYYGKGYRAQGYQPWALYGPQRFEPLFSYYTHLGRDNRGWRADRVALYEDRVRGLAPLPPRTLAAQQILLARANSGPRPAGGVASLQLLQPPGSYRSNALRLSPTSRADMTAGRQMAVNLSQAAADRRREEAASVVPGAGINGHRHAGLPVDRMSSSYNGAPRVARQPLVPAFPHGSLPGNSHAGAPRGPQDNLRHFAPPSHGPSGPYAHGPRWSESLSPRTNVSPLPPPQHHPSASALRPPPHGPAPLPHATGSHHGPAYNPGGAAPAFHPHAAPQHAPAPHAQAGGHPAGVPHSGGHATPAPHHSGGHAPLSSHHSGGHATPAPHHSHHH